MWNCKECNFIMKDSDISCRDCGAPKPGTAAYQKFIEKREDEELKKKEKVKEESSFVDSKKRILQEVEVEKVVISPDVSNIIERAVYNRKKEILRHYKLSVDVEKVSEAEYDKLIRYFTPEKKHVIETQKDDFSTILNRIGYSCFVIFAIAGFIVGNSDLWGGRFNLPLAVGVWVTGFINGVIFMGFARVIELLNDIKEKL